MVVAVRQLLLGAAMGAVLAGVGIVLAPGDDTTVPPPGTTVVTAREPTDEDGFWHDRYETPLGPAVLVPERLVVDAGAAVLTYRVVGITSARRGLVFEEDLGPPVGPEVFVLQVGGTEYRAATTRIDSTEVSFDVPAGTRAADVTGLRVERYRVRVPHAEDVDLPAAPGSGFTLEEGVSISVATVLAQTETVLVNIDTARPADAFLGARNPIVWVTGRGPAWQSTVRQSGAGIGGTTGVQLIYRGSEIPDPLPLTVTSPRWIARDRPIDVDITGLRRG